MSRRRLVLVASITLLVSGCASYPPGEARLLTGPYLQDLRTDAVTVMAEAGDEIPVTLAWRAEGTSEWRNAEVVARPWKVKYTDPYSGVTHRMLHVLYQATIDGLQPGGSYEYSLRAADETRAGKFRTLVPRGKPFRFAAYGDSRTRPMDHHAVCTGILKTRPTFVLHTGDLVSDGRVYPEWERTFFGPGRDLFMNVPVFPVLGNHERNAYFFYDYFQLPSDEEYRWSFDCGDVHFVGVDPLQDWWSWSGQVRWLREDLADSTARWNVVVLHQPPFSRSTGHYSTRAVRDILQPILEESKVDLLLAGHNHVYERTHAIARGFDDEGRPHPPGALPASRPVVHVITGGGGAPLYNIDPIWWTASCRKVNHFCLFDVSPDRLQMRAIDKEGNEIDRLVLTKADDEPAPEAVKDVVYIEQIRLDESLRKSIGRTRFPEVTGKEATSFDLDFQLKKRYPQDVEVSVSWDTGDTGWTVTPHVVHATLDGGSVKVRFHFRLDPSKPATPPVMKLQTRTVLAERTVDVLMNEFD